MAHRAFRQRKSHTQNQIDSLHAQGIKFQREPNGVLKIPKANGEIIFYKPDTGFWRTEEGVRGRGITQLKQYLEQPVAGLPTWEIRLFRQLFAKAYNEAAY